MKHLGEWESFFRDQIQVCPGCGAAVTFETSNGGSTVTVDVMHPQPPCDGFRAFVELLEAAAHQPPRGRWQLS